MMNETHAPQFRRDLPAPGFWTHRQARRKTSGRWDTLAERMQPKITVAHGDACWEWAASRSQSGYGQIDGVGAHRLSLYLATGVDPGQLFTLHRCDNPPCVRAAHLFLGTNDENMADAAAKGRMKGGLIHSDETVELVRELYRQGRGSDSIATLTGVSQQQVLRLAQARSRTKEPVVPVWTRPGIRGAGMKLTEAQVVEVRLRYAAGGVTQRVLAREFDIDQSYVSMIVNHHPRVR